MPWMLVLAACQTRSPVTALQSPSLIVRLDGGPDADRVIVELSGEPPSSCRRMDVTAAIDGVDLGRDEGPDPHDEGNSEYCRFHRWVADRTVLKGGAGDRVLTLSDGLGELTATVPTPFPKRHLLPDGPLPAFGAGSTLRLHFSGDGVPGGSAQAWLAPVGGAVGEGGRVYLAAAVDDEGVTVTFPDGLTPGVYQLLARATIEVPIECADFARCSANLGARFVHSVTVE